MPFSPPPPPPPSPVSGNIEIQQFKKLRWSPETGSFKSQGDVVVVFTPNDGTSPTRLNARDVEYTGNSGVISATGNTRLLRSEGEFTGDSVQYNFGEQTGTIFHASLRANINGTLFTMKGDQIEQRAKDDYILQKGYFTTCNNDGTPHYSIYARELELSPKQFVRAKEARLSLFGTSLFTLPTLRRSLKERSTVSLPSPSYSKAEGITFRYSQQVIREPSRTFDFDLRLSLRGLPIGFVQYQTDLNKLSPNALPPLGQQSILTEPLLGYLDRLSPLTFQDVAQSRLSYEPEPRATLYAVLQNRQFVYNRTRDKIQVSRYPEVGVQFSNLLGKRLAEGQTPNYETTADSLISHLSNAPFLLDVAASGGLTHEEPTHVDAGRLSLRTNVATQPFLLRRNVSVRFGVSDWLNAYSRGTVYHLISPEADLNYVPTHTSFFSVGYRYATDEGRTPFDFDRRDLRHELRLTWQGGGPWGFRITNRYNIENWRSYDSEIAIVRNLDCLQYGLAYRFQTQQFNIIFNFNPSGRQNAQKR